MGIIEERPDKSKKLIAVINSHDDDIYCFRKELLEGIKAEGYDLLISCPYGEKFELLGDLDYLYHDLKIDRRGTNVIADFKLIITYCKLMRRYRPDVVIAYSPKPNIYGGFAARFLKIPMINNLTGFGSTLKSNNFSDKLLMKLYKIAYKKSRCVFFQNESNLKFDLDNGIVTGPYQLVPGSGVNTKRYPLQPYPNDDVIVFNYLGRVMHDKGIDDYIECARRIKKNHPNTEFNVIGFVEPTEIHYQEDLKKLEDEGIIIYRGQQMDVRPFIARAHAIIHPSMYGEGMSNVLLENASSGRPVITTDNPGCKETLNDGVTGFMYHAGNVDELVEKVELFLSMSNEDRRKMGEKGREKVSKEFSRDFVVRTYLDKFAEILSQ